MGFDVVRLLARALSRRVRAHRSKASAHWWWRDPPTRRRVARPLGLALAIVALWVSGLSLGSHSPQAPRADPASATVLSSTTSVFVPPATEGPAGAALPSPDANPAPVAPDKRTALIIGINHASGAAPLAGAVRDAEMTRQALLEYGFPERNIVVLTEGAATLSRILTELDALAARTPADGRAVVEFAGHTRIRGGENQFLAADGERLSASVLAGKLRAVQAPMWVVLSTCYAEGYALPGVVGPDRVATFASGRNQLAYELGGSGSWLVLNMVEYGMLDGGAPLSVETAFEFAREKIARENPNRVPVMEDDFRGGFVLGPVPRAEMRSSSSGPPYGTGPQNLQPSVGDPQASPAPGSGRTGQGWHEPVGVCWQGYRYNCN